MNRCKQQPAITYNRRNHMKTTQLYRWRQYYAHQIASSYEAYSVHAILVQKLGMQLGEHVMERIRFRRCCDWFDAFLPGTSLARIWPSAFLFWFSIFLCGWDHFRQEQIKVNSSEKCRIAENPSILEPNMLRHQDVFDLEATTSRRNHRNKWLFPIRSHLL